jgi:hypothetical protein
MGQVQRKRRRLSTVARTASTERIFERLRSDGPATRSPRKSISLLLAGRRGRSVERPWRDVIATTPPIPCRPSETGDGDQLKAGEGGRDVERLESCSVLGVPRNPAQRFENARFRFGRGRVPRGRPCPIPGIAPDRVFERNALISLDSDSDGGAGLLCGLPDKHNQAWSNIFCSALRRAVVTVFGLGVPQNPAQRFEKARFRLGLGRAYPGRPDPIPGIAPDRNCPGRRRPHTRPHPEERRSRRRISKGLPRACRSLPRGRSHAGPFWNVLRDAHFVGSSG